MIGPSSTTNQEENIMAQELTPKAQRNADAWEAIVNAENLHIGQHVRAARVTTDSRGYVTRSWWEPATIIELRTFDAVVQFEDGTRASSGLGLETFQRPVDQTQGGNEAMRLSGHINVLSSRVARAVALGRPADPADMEELRNATDALIAIAG